MNYRGVQRVGWVHLVPLEDDHDHITNDGPNCWCLPDVILVTGTIQHVPWKVRTYRWTA